MASLLAATPAAAADKLVIGTILPLSGPFADQGGHYETGMRMYQAAHGTTVAGRELQIVIRDDQGPGSGDLARRLTQELIAREKAEIIVGYSFTPTAMVSAPVLTQAKTPGIIINAMTSVITEKSPYFTRVSGTMPMETHTLGQWAAANGIRSAYTIVSDYAPGIDAETWFVKGFEAAGGRILGKDRTPVTAMEYGPFLQRAIEAKPDAVFAFNPGGDVSIAFMKQAGSRLAGTGIRLLVTGDVVDDNQLPSIGAAIKDVISVWHYQVDIDNPTNKAFLQAFRARHGANAQPSYRVVQGYDAMEVIYRTLEKSGGKAGDAFMTALKGSEFKSPRGTFRIDPETREIIENIYIRRGEFVDGAGFNRRIAVIESVKDPAK